MSIAMKSKNYGHYCPIARSLEVIGEKWSLLVVRDLIRGPQRFSDLHRYLGGITPKWLSNRLKELEAAGIVERESEPGRREVWYSLTEKGRALTPIVQELLVWGVDYALRPPAAGEPVNPEQTTYAIAAYHNRKGTTLPHPVDWQVVVDRGPDIHVSFDGSRWRVRPTKERPDLTVRTTREGFVRFLTTPRPDRSTEELAFEGDPERVDEFLQTFGVLREAAAAR